MDSNRNATSGSMRNRARRLAATACVFALAAGAAHGATPVIDVAHIAKTALVYATEQQQLQQLITQYQQLVEAYVLQARQYEQLFINLQNAPNAVPSLDNSFVHLDATQLAEAQCGDPGEGEWLGGLIASLLSSENPLAESQRKICQQVVSLQVTKYNETADILTRLNNYARLAQHAEAQREEIAGDSGNGDLAGNSNQVHRNAAQLAMEMDNWKGRMGAYDTQLQALRDAQAMLAQAALRGRSPDLLGTSVQALALKAALELNP